MLCRSLGALSSQIGTRCLVASCSFTTGLAEQSTEPDKLYKTVNFELQSHDKAVLNSYETVIKQLCGHLDITISRIDTPVRPLIYRRTMVKSAFVHKKHRVQYETRTYLKHVDVENVTGSTADTVIEYLQRQLPEGVGMMVTKHEITQLPDSLVKVSDNE